MVGFEYEKRQELGLSLRQELIKEPYCNIYFFRIYGIIINFVKYNYKHVQKLLQATNRLHTIPNRLNNIKPPVHHCNHCIGNSKWWKAFLPTTTPWEI